MSANQILELRVYTLHPGMRDAFDARFHDEVLPMLVAHGIDVVVAAPSLHDADSYCLLRAYPSIGARQAALDTFYGSEAWLSRHDEAVMAMIASYSTVVLDAAPPLIDALVSGLGRRPGIRP